MVGFAAVTRTCTRSDICRYFLASLSLANSGNIQIDESSQLEQFQFEVKSTLVERPMETYLAPSLQVNNNSS